MSGTTEAQTRQLNVQLVAELYNAENKVKALLEALNREHQRVLNWRDESGWPKHDPDCPVCQLIKRCEG